MSCNDDFLFWKTYANITSTQLRCGMMGSPSTWLGCPFIPIHPEEVQHSGSTSATIIIFISLLLCQGNELKQFYSGHAVN